MADIAFEKDLSVAETFNGLMAIPNLIAVFLLSGVVVKLTKEYFAKENG